MGNDYKVQKTTHSLYYKKHYTLHEGSHSDLQNIITCGCGSNMEEVVLPVMYKIVSFHFCLADGSSDKTSSRNQVPDY